MENEIYSQNEDFNNDEIDLDIDLSEDEEETKSEKQVESPEARISRLERQLAQAKKKAGRDEPKKTSDKEVGLDRMDKMILRQEGIKTSDEIELVESIARDTGKTVEQIIDSRFFQSELKELRESRSAKDAIPSGARRSQQTSKDNVDYWIAKGELPKDDPALRQQVVKAKVAKERAKSTFSSNAIID